MNLDWKKMDGQIPCIVQHADSGQVLMLGYMNEEALRMTQATGFVTFFSRSKGRLWTKGESSGHTLELVRMAEDCDSDALLVFARPNGPTCHTGTPSCFEIEPHTFHQLTDLQSTIQSRKKSDPSESYTAQLLSEGIQRCAQKVGEEGVEVALAAACQDDATLLNESADLLYHLLIALTARDLTLEQVLEVLRGRQK